MKYSLTDRLPYLAKHWLQKGQLRTIDKRRLKDKVCHLDGPMLDKVNHALEISLELTFS